jgi:hypothetical protein
MPGNAGQKSKALSSSKHFTLLSPPQQSRCVVTQVLPLCPLLATDLAKSELRFISMILQFKAVNYFSSKNVHKQMVRASENNHLLQRSASNHLE